MCLEPSTRDRSNVYHPLQPKQLSTVFRLNPDLNRVEYFSCSGEWNSIGLWFTRSRKPKEQMRELKSLGPAYVAVPYGKTYLEPIRL